MQKGSRIFKYDFVFDGIILEWYFRLYLTFCIITNDS